MKEYLFDNSTQGRFTNWVDTIARRTKYAYIKNETKHISHACIDDVPEEYLGADEMDMDFTKNDKQFEFESAWLKKAFEKLSKSHRRLLELLYVEEKTPQEVAMILGCTIENVYNQRSKAFKAIKERKDK